MTELVAQPLVHLQRASHIPRSIDNTALDSYMACPRKFYYSMELGRKREGGLSPALAYGSIWHTILETHYKTGGDKHAVVQAAVSNWQPHSNPDDHRTLERAVTEYGRFLEKWGDHDADCSANGATVGFAEGNPIVEWPVELSWPGALHPYAGKIDRIIQHQGLYYVEDHKTTSAMGPSYFRQFDPSNQMMGYAWLAQHLTGLPIAGVRVNAHAVLKTISKFERQLVCFSQDRLQEWSRNYNAWVTRVNQSYIILDNPEDGSDGEGSLLSAFPHNFQACAGKYGQCTYTDVCTMPPRLRGRVLESDYIVQPWDPMAAAEEAAE